MAPLTLMEFERFPSWPRRRPSRANDSIENAKLATKCGPFHNVIPAKAGIHANFRTKKIARRRVRVRATYLTFGGLPWVPTSVGMTKVKSKGVLLAR
jgi:hypothetical protein